MAIELYFFCGAMWLLASWFFFTRKVPLSLQTEVKAIDGLLGKGSGLIFAKIVMVVCCLILVAIWPLHMLWFFKRR